LFPLLYIWLAEVLIKYGLPAFLSQGSPLDFDHSTPFIVKPFLPSAHTPLQNSSKETLRSSPVI